MLGEQRRDATCNGKYGFQSIAEQTLILKVIQHSRSKSSQKQHVYEELSSLFSAKEKSVEGGKCTRKARIKRQRQLVHR